MVQYHYSFETLSKSVISLAYLPSGKRWTPKIYNERFLETGDKLIEELVKAIEQAKHSICFSSFIFQDNKVINALIEAADRGVKVFLITSTAYLSQRNTFNYEEEEDFKAEEFKKLLNDKFQNLILVRCADNIHAKFILIDPQGISPKGFLATCNFTNHAIYKNPELVVILNQNETSEFFKVFVSHFWEATTDEQVERGTFDKIKPLNRFQLPELNNVLLTSTSMNLCTLRTYVKELIENATSEITISTYNFDISHQLSELLLRKCKEGIKVTIFTRPRFKVLKNNVEKLIQAGAVVHLHKFVHAKFIVVDDQKGAIFSANFEGQGMDKGFETGLKLSEQDVLQLQEIITNWKNEFEYHSKLNIPIQETPEVYYTMNGQALKEEQLKLCETHERSIKPQNFNELMKVFQQKREFDHKKVKKSIFTLKVQLEEISSHNLHAKKQLHPHFYWGEYIVPSKKKEDATQEKPTIKEVLFFTSKVKNLEMLRLWQEDYGKLSIFVLKD